MDMYVDFIDIFLIRTDKKTDKISFQEIHDNFKGWFQQNMNSYKFPVKNEMKKHFEKKYGKKNCSTTHLIGFIKNNEYDNDEEVLI
jgi:plasmid replication initiation protein